MQFSHFLRHSVSLSKLAYVPFLPVNADSIFRTKTQKNTAEETILAFLCGTLFQDSFKINCSEKYRAPPTAAPSTLYLLVLM